MSKWKCEICGNEFENFHAQGFDNKIYCPLCYFKKENQKLETEKEQLNSLVNSCQEEIRRLKKQLEEKNKSQIFIDTQDIEERYAEGLYQDYLEEENKKYKKQQKEFIEYMNKTIEELQCDDVDDEEMKGYLIQRIDTFKEIFSKYKKIIGVLNEKINVL